MADLIALPWLLAPTGKLGNHELDLTPLECCDCPFATVNPDREPPNWADPGEGYYDCALLDRKAIWGESPECTQENWLARGRAELEQLRAEVHPLPS